MANNHRRVRRLSATVRSFSMDMQQQHHNNIGQQQQQDINSRFKIDLARVANKSGGPEPRCWRQFTDNWPKHSQTAALFIIFLLFWGILYSIQPQLALPTNNFMKFLFLFVGAQLCGMVVSKFGIPDVLGMIFWGVLYRNVGFADYGEMVKVESFLRELALVNIMLLAGLGLDLSAAKEYIFSILKLTFIPMIAEVGIVAALSHFLMGMPWIWGVLLGFIITAISPNVVVTVVLSLKEQKLGSIVIHTIILAVTTFNDVLAIFCSGVLLGVIFSTGNTRNQILQGPVAIGIGIIFGGVYGFFMGHLPSNYSRFKNTLRFMLTICGGLFVVCGSKAIGFPAAGALGCAVLSVTANASWKSSNQVTENKVDDYLNVLWKFVKPISFALIGKEVYFAVLEGAALYGIVVVAAAALLRVAFAYVSLLGQNNELSGSEKIYLAISSLPKATIQASIGPLALEYVAKYNAQEHFDLANSVLICSVLAIILTAPLGALLMVKLSPRLLRKEPDLDDEPL